LFDDVHVDVEEEEEEATDVFGGNVGAEELEGADGAGGAKELDGLDPALGDVW
jgi:hypothetical protein